MKSRASFLRVLVPLLVAVGAIAGLVMAVGSAGASPAPPGSIAPQSPADNSPVAATEEGLKVSFSCPTFVFEEGEVLEEKQEIEREPGESVEEEKEKEEEEELLPPIITEIPPTIGNAENYAVHFSTSGAVDKAGLIGTTGFGEGGEGEAEAIKNSAALCESELELPSAPIPATLYEGKIFWQAYRESEAVPDGIEVGPVRSFNVFPHVEEPELTFREQIFAGYLTQVGFGYEAELGGAVVQLQVWEGSAWKTVAEAPGSNSGENTFYVKLKKPGRYDFRPLVLGGAQQLGLESVAKVVRKPSKVRVTSASDDGPYVAASKKEQEESPIEFSVKGNGTVLKNLKLEAETTCKGPTKAQNVTIEVAAALGHAKIAPDGTVFGVAKTEGTEVWTTTLSGSIFQGRFQGELSTSHANCTGYRTIDAVLSKAPKKK
jgi:hypothetical protein